MGVNDERRVVTGTAERVSATFLQAADAFDESARLAELEAERYERTGRPELAEQERQVARRARETSERARRRARAMAPSPAAER